jgi:hypothetical protein
LSSGRSLSEELKEEEEDMSIMDILEGGGMKVWGGEAGGELEGCWLWL